MPAISEDNNIDRFTVMNCVFNQPLAPPMAYQRFIEQTAVKEISTARDPDPKARMIIIDSSENPGDINDPKSGFGFFSKLRDTRVTYLHMPVRPGRKAPADMEERKAAFPAAYSWMAGGANHDIYLQTIPHDRKLHTEFADPNTQRLIKEHDPKAFKLFMEHAVHGDFRRAITEVFENMPWKVHDRPHLGSKRNFVMALGARQGSKAIVYADDDVYGERYVENQLRVLKSGQDMTSLSQYPTLVYTREMAADGKLPIWAITDLNRTGPAVSVGWGGEREQVLVEKATAPMGFTYAVRIPKFEDLHLHPKVPNILGGEDRGFLDHLTWQNYRVRYQPEFNPNVVRLVFGVSSSTNIFSETMGPLHPLMPDEKTRRTVADHLAYIYPPLAAYKDAIIHPHGQPELSAKKRVEAGSLGEFVVA